MRPTTQQRFDRAVEFLAYLLLVAALLDLAVNTDMPATATVTPASTTAPIHITPYATAFPTETPHPAWFYPTPRG